MRTNIQQTDTHAVIFRTVFYVSYEMEIKVNTMFGNFGLFAWICFAQNYC